MADIYKKFSEKDLNKVNAVLALLDDSCKTITQGDFDDPDLLEKIRIFKSLRGE